MLDQKPVIKHNKIFNLSFFVLLESYQIREVIYIESNLRTSSWFKSNIIDKEIVDIYPKKSVLSKTNEEAESESEDSQESSSKRQRSSEYRKLLDIVNMLCTQAKHVLAKEIQLEKILRQLLSTTRKK